MTIDFECDERLPPLAWCARARAGAPLRVRHGTRVETRRDGFVEGVWDDEFEAFDFDRAVTLAGSGGRVRGSRVVFAAPFHPLERLFVVRTGDHVALLDAGVGQGRGPLDSPLRNPTDS